MFGEFTNTEMKIMQVRRIATLFAAWAIAVPLAHAGNVDHADFWLTARVSLDANGKVTSLAFDDRNAKQDDIIGTKLGAVIRGWLFEPGRVNGKPVTTQTGLLLHMDLRKLDADDFSISVLSADTGATLAMKSAPAYPYTQLFNGTEAEVLLRIDYDTDGKVVQTSVADAVGSGSTRDINAFVHAAKQTAGSKWCFRPEVVDGHPIAGTALVPVSFCVKVTVSGCTELQQKVAQRRVEQGLQALTTQPISLNKQVRLLTQVAGIVL